MMLLRLAASNYRSVMAPIELSMIAIDKDRPAARDFPLLSERVLTVAGIYGPNASGKSNVLEAIAWLSMAVARSLRSWDTIIPREPFRFGNGPHEPSSYEAEMVVGGVRYVYEVELDDYYVFYEALSSYPERRKRVLFVRENADISFRRGLGSLAGTRELLTPTTLALSAAMRFDEPEIVAFGRALADIRPVSFRRGLGGSFRFHVPLGAALAATERLFEDADSGQPSLFDDVDSADIGMSAREQRESALALLRFADLGIDDVKISEVEDETTELAPPARRVSKRQLRLIHRVADQDLPFEIADESAGTQTWFALIGPVLGALRRGGIVLIDEIDASLHPQLSARLVELFQDPHTNPRGAQLIFTTHDTSLLSHLNRDEVWLTEKHDDGATTLTALAEYGGDKVRRSLNLERAYLQGRFGAVPDLDQSNLDRLLGAAPGSG